MFLGIWCQPHSCVQMVCVKVCERECRAGRDARCFFCKCMCVFVSMETLWEKKKSVSFNSFQGLNMCQPIKTQ